MNVHDDSRPSARHLADPHEVIHPAQGTWMRNATLVLALLVATSSVARGQTPDGEPQLAEVIERAVDRISESRAPRSWTRDRGARAERAEAIRRAYLRALTETEVPPAWARLHDLLFPRATRVGCEAAPGSAAQMAAVRVAVLRGLPRPSTVLAERPRCERLYVGRRRVNLIRVSRRGSLMPVVSQARPAPCERPGTEGCFRVEIRHGGASGCVDRYLTFRLHDRTTARLVASSCDEHADDRR